MQKNLFLNSSLSKITKTIIESLSGRKARENGREEGRKVRS
jgi:hypothetical protein